MQELKIIFIDLWKLFLTIPKKITKNDPKVIIEEMKKCKYCGVKRWPAKSSGLYCLEGKINLPTIQDSLEFLKSLWRQNTPAAKHFRRNLLKYNFTFQMTSLGADKNMTDLGFLTTYIKGQCYLLMGGLLPTT